MTVLRFPPPTHSLHLAPPPLPDMHHRCQTNPWSKPWGGGAGQASRCAGFLGLTSGWGGGRGGLELGQEAIVACGPWPPRHTRTGACPGLCEWWWWWWWLCMAVVVVVAEARPGRGRGGRTGGSQEQHACLPVCLTLSTPWVRCGMLCSGFRYGAWVWVLMPVFDGLGPQGARG